MFSFVMFNVTGQSLNFRLHPILAFRVSATQSRRRAPVGEGYAEVARGGDDPEDAEDGSARKEEHPAEQRVPRPHPRQRPRPRAVRGAVARGGVEQRRPAEDDRGPELRTTGTGRRRRSVTNGRRHDGGHPPAGTLTMAPLRACTSEKKGIALATA